MKNLILTLVVLAALTNNGMSAQIQSTKISFPIALVAEDENTVLQWSSSKEVNSSYFLIETSSDNSHFTLIGKVKAAGYSQNKKEYHLTTSIQNEIKTFVRVSLVSMDGERESTLLAITNYNLEDSLLSSK